MSREQIHSRFFVDSSPSRTAAACSTGAARGRARQLGQGGEGGAEGDVPCGGLGGCILYWVSFNLVYALGGAIENAVFFMCGG